MFRTHNMEFPVFQSFPILKLPTVVLFHMIEYLNKKERGILSRVNRQFREIMNSPNHWKNTTFVLSPKKLDNCKHIVSFLRPRKAESVVFAKTRSKEIQRAILSGIPSLKDITIDNPRLSTLDLIVSHAKGITKLHLGMVSTEKTPNLTLHFKELENLVDVSLDRHAFKSDPDMDITEEIKSALCYHGNLRSLQLHSFFSVDLEWICEIVQKNPKLESLGLFFVRNITMEGQFERSMFNQGLATVKQNSTLKELNLCGSLRSNSIMFRTITWLDTCPSLIYLNLSFCLDKRILRMALLNLYKLPNLQKLDISKSALRNDMLCENLPKLCSLEMKSCFGISGKGLRTLSSVMGNSLKYLGLSNCNRIENEDLSNLTSMFPCLHSIDLSGCVGISDVLLYHIFCDGELPKLRKIILKGCSHINEWTVKMARKVSMNKIIFIL